MILHQDAHLIAVNKPAGVFVHPAARGRDGGDHLVGRLTAQLGNPVFPAHRLDRPTTGVLLFARDAATARALAEQLAAHQMEKRYWAITRGVPSTDGSEEALVDERGVEQAASTRWRISATVEVPLVVAGRTPNRYALLDVRPRTGRRHQIRRHLAHLNHPVIGDVAHGDYRHNRVFRDQLGVQGLLLHAAELRLLHPDDGRPICLTAPPPDAFRRAAERFGWASVVVNHAP